MLKPNCAVPAKPTLRQTVLAGCALAVFLSSLSGCGSTASSMQDFEAYLTDPRAPRLMVQVCLPDRQAFFDELTVDVTDMPADEQERRRIFLAGRERGAYANPPRSDRMPREYETIRQWRAPQGNIGRPWLPFDRVANVRGVASSTGGPGYLAGSTEGDQAVFADFTHLRPSDVIAVGVDVAVLRDGKTERRTFWFRPPTKLPALGFTPWGLPVSEEVWNGLQAGPRTWWLLAHGKDMPMQPVGADAPRARFLLMSDDEYWQQVKDGRRAIDTVKLQRLVDKLPDPRDGLRLLPARRDVIPSC
jgi:hypothetical protein